MKAKHKQTSVYQALRKQNADVEVGSVRLKNIVS